MNFQHGISLNLLLKKIFKINHLIKSLKKVKFLRLKKVIISSLMIVIQILLLKTQ